MDKFLVRDKLLKWTQDDKEILKSPISTNAEMGTFPRKALT